MTKTSEHIVITDGVGPSEAVLFSDDCLSFFFKKMFV